MPAAAQTPDSIAWTFDSLEKIGGMRPALLGHPRVIDSTVGSAIECNGKDDAIYGYAEQRSFPLSKKDLRTGQDTQVRMLFETRIRKGGWHLDSYVTSAPKPVESM